MFIRGEYVSKNRERGWSRNKKTPPGIWRDGVRYFSTWYLADALNMDRRAVYRWFMKRPHLCIRYQDHFWLCRTDQGRPRPDLPDTGVRRSIIVDDLEYFSIPELARRRGVNQNTTRKWVKRHPHLVTVVGKHTYCRDEDYTGPCSRRRMLMHDGLTFYSIPELASRRGISERTAWEWAQKHPHLSHTVRNHRYYREEEYGQPKKAAPVIERDGHTYYSTAELSKRRGVCRQSARGWATRHPELTIRQGRFLYTRDEQYTPHKESANLPIHLKTLAARRHRA